MDGGGKGETANLLNTWMDPRHIVTKAFGRPSDEEAERPEYWRFWRTLPARGQLGVFLRAWYSKPLLQHVYQRTSALDFERQMRRIVDFERTLASEGTRIIKFWMHLGKTAQAERFRTLESDPNEAWRITELDWKHWEMYESFVETSERLIARTDQPLAPWHIVDGRQASHRSLVVGEAVLKQLRLALDGQDHTALTALSPPKRQEPAPVEITLSRPIADPTPAPADPLQQIDLDLSVSRGEYRDVLPALQGRLNRLARLASSLGQSTIVVFEGWDASGKGGAIRRIASSLDARWYQVIPIGPPTDEEGSHHYLWRFWRHLPRAGRITVFDRSWYGRVLVERIEGFASPAEWQRAFTEINDFERRLTDHGMIVVKFWMHISQEEQAQRFNARLNTPYKRWKLTEEDWRNRDKRPAYEEAVNDMLNLTDTPTAPWVPVAANNKAYARIRVLSEMCRQLEAQLEVPPDFDLPDLPTSVAIPEGRSE